MPTPNLYLRLTHTGHYADGRASTAPVIISDLDVGYEYQFRKSAVYVPPGIGGPNFINLTMTSRALISFEQGCIKKAVDAGLITATLFLQPESYTNVNRPAASLYPKGCMIWNDDDHAPNFSDGGVPGPASHWRDAMGTITD